MASGNKKVSEPEYMKLSKNILSLTMKDEHTIPFKEIAEQTGDTINTLISRKRYAVLHLRERLGTLKNELLNHS